MFVLCTVLCYLIVAAVVMLCDCIYDIVGLRVCVCVMILRLRLCVSVLCYCC